MSLALRGHRSLAADRTRPRLREKVLPEGSVPQHIPTTLDLC